MDQHKEVPVVPKKRGRKAGSTVVKQENTASSASASIAKRGRKSKQVMQYQQVSDDVIRCHSDDENVVLNLKVLDTLEEDEFDNSEYPPHPYNFEMQNVFQSKPFDLNMSYINEEYQTQSTPILPDNSYDMLKVVQLLKDFEQKNKLNEWPTSTSINCYWCCHRFNNVPFGIPVKFSNEKFFVIGCFCSLECCAAYNMAHHTSTDEMWERYMLINMLARKIGYKNIVKPSPNRLTLKLFGGHMEIDEFRMYCLTSKIVILNYPPMMTVTQQIEEVNECDITNDYKYIPIDTDRINKYKMKLKKQMPAKKTNTLDHTMNLQISS